MWNNFVVINIVCIFAGDNNNVKLKNIVIMNDYIANDNSKKENTNDPFENLKKLLYKFPFNDVSNCVSNYTDQVTPYLKDNDKNKSKSWNLSQYMIDKKIVDEKVAKKELEQLGRALYDLKWFQDNQDNCIEYLQNYYNAGDRLYTLSIYDIISNVVKIVIKEQSNCNDFDELNKVLYKLRDIFNKHDIMNNKINMVDEKNCVNIRKKYLHKLDGMDVLISKLEEKAFIQMAIAGSYFFSKDLVQYSINLLSEKFKKSVNKGKELNDNQGTWINKLKEMVNDLNSPVKDFFMEILEEDKEIDFKVNKFINYLNKKRLELKNIQTQGIDEKELDKIKKKLTDELCYLEARYTTDKGIVVNSSRLMEGDNAIYAIEEENKMKYKYRVTIDDDGNNFVRSQINKTTGITISQGKESVMQNMIISHVWGNAYDPRYFTSLWNIVLIPAWANSLMDKDGAPQETLASKMRATYMQVCRTLYSEVQFPKNSESEQNKQYGYYLTELPAVNNFEDIVPGNYSFNIINGNIVEGVNKRKSTDPIFIVTETRKILKFKTTNNNETPPCSTLAPAVNSTDM